ncbi:MAG TPA: TetR family transcriptional regulator [Rhizomicrobium sp.]|jgi:AcrR family transcriptional regulator|nr:TetR family transcriptional regulator [Rhizomicrobium sp.]
MDKPAKTLTPDAIAEAALALVDEKGLDAFSTRKLGARLGVEAMALYHHFPNKGLLMRRAAAKLRESIPLPADKAMGWRAWMGQAARSTRAVALTRPRAFALLGPKAFVPPAALRVLVSAGFPERDAARMARIMAAFLNGIIAAEIAEPEAMEGAFERGLVMMLDGIARSLQRVSAPS